MLRILAFALLAQSSQGLAPRAASTRRRWLAAAPGLLLLRPSEPATAVTPGGEFCICNDKGCFGENCGGLKRPDVKYLGAATESYGQELSGASAALSGSRRGGGGAPRSRSRRRPPRTRRRATSSARCARPPAKRRRSRGRTEGSG